MSAKRYLALGDSYTIGTGASDPSRSWPWIVASRLGAEWICPAVNGFTTLDLIACELPFVRRVQPEWTSVLIGVNDLVQGRRPDEYRKSLTQIYGALAGKVAAISIPTWSYVPAAADFGGAERVDELTKVFNEVAREEATARGYRWIDITEVSASQIGSPGWIASDQLHPGDAQYAAWADVIWFEMRDLLKT